VLLVCDVCSLVSIRVMAALMESLVSMASRGFKPFIQKNVFLNSARTTKTQVKLDVKSVLPRVRPRPSCSSHSKSVQLQNFFSPLLRSFKTTIASDASKLTSKFNGLRGLSKRNFFYKDYLARRARYSGYLFSFGGLVFMQDQFYEEVEERDQHFQSYISLCSTIKTMFNSPQLIREKEDVVNWNNYKIGKQIFTKQNSTVYEFNKCEQEDFEETESFDLISYDSSAESFTRLSHHSEEIEEQNFNDEIEDGNQNYAVEVIKRKQTQSLVLPLYDRPHQAKVYNGRFNSDSILHWRESKVGYHPNIVMVQHLYTDDARDVPNNMVKFNTGMEFLFRFDQTGKTDLNLVTNRYEETLTSYTNSHKMDEETVMVIVLQLLEAVSFLRSRLTVHRKISPETIYVESNVGDGYPRVLLGDFLDAFQVSSENELLVPFENVLFDTRVSFNLWQAPEIFSAKPGKRRWIDYRNSDVWSVGIITKFLFGQISSMDEDSTDTSNKIHRSFGSIFSASLLNPDPQLRLKPDEAADILHLQLFNSFNPDQIDTMNADYEIYDEISGWLTEHCIDFIFRQHDDKVLNDLCWSFFKRLDFKRLAFSAVKWGEFCGC